MGDGDRAGKPDTYRDSCSDSFWGIHTLEMSLWAGPWALWCFILHSCTEGNAIKLYRILVPYKVSYTNNLRKILNKLQMTCHPSTCLKLLVFFNHKRMIRYCKFCRQILHLYRPEQVCAEDKKSHTTPQHDQVYIELKTLVLWASQHHWQILLQTQNENCRTPQMSHLNQSAAGQVSEALMQPWEKLMGESNTFENNVGFFPISCPFLHWQLGKVTAQIQFICWRDTFYHTFPVLAIPTPQLYHQSNSPQGTVLFPPWLPSESWEIPYAHFT